MRRASAFVTAALLGMAALAAPAAAHMGRWPSSISLTERLAPAPAVRWIALAFGPVWTRDGGETWQWACEEALGYADWFDPTYVLRADGTLLTSVFDGVARSDDGGCSWAKTTVGPTGGRVTSMATNAAVPDTYFLSVSVAGGASGVYRSADGGATWAPVLELPASSLSRVLWSPADPLRLYALSQAADQTASTLHRSDDGGDTWADLPLDAALGGAVPALLAAGRGGADVVFVDRQPGTGDDAVLRSEDGGATFVEWAHVGERIAAFAERADGSVWLATPTQLLVSADGAGALAAAPGNPPGTVRCLVELDDGLYACADNYGDDYSVGRTADGTTWEPVFRFEDMDDLLDCPAGTPVHDICGPLWPTVQDTFVPPPPPPGSDGGAGCACRAAGARSARPGDARPAVALLILVALALWAARPRTPAPGAHTRRA